MEHSSVDGANILGAVTETMRAVVLDGPGPPEALVIRDLEYLPRGVRLTAYGGEAADLPPRLLQGYLDSVAAGTAVVPIGRVYRFDQIVEAHRAMEGDQVSGKLVVTT
jgi:hypothetical protein